MHNRKAPRVVVYISILITALINTIHQSISHTISTPNYSCKST